MGPGGIAIVVLALIAALLAASAWIEAIADAAIAREFPETQPSPADRIRFSGAGE